MKPFTHCDRIKVVYLQSTNLENEHKYNKGGLELDTALLVLDIQKDYIGDQARMSVAKHQIEPMLDRVNTIIDTFNSHGIPVMYIGNEFEPHQWMSNFFRKNSAIKGSKGAELDERLLMVNDVIFQKTSRVH